MIDAIIRASIAHRGLVVVLALVLFGAGLYALRETPVDAIPDLSDPQVIVRAPYPGQAPQVVENQVTYPLTTALMAVPGAHTVRGFSMFGDAFITILFEEGTDPYWARARVLEYLSQVSGRLPDGVRAELGPDATGVGWIYKYVLVDRSGTTDLAELRALQDWFLKFELQAVSGVSEVATMGGQVRGYQVIPDPNRLRALGLDLRQLRQAIEANNAETGGSLIELAEAEYMVRADGYLQSLADLRAVPTGLVADGTPVLLGDVAEIRRGPVARRGMVELDGEGEVVGGIVVMRHGENARAVIERVKARLDELAGSLPEGVEIVETYDRSGLIDAAVSTLWTKLVGEFVVVVLIIGLFLWHFRSSLVVLVSLPLGVMAAFVIMQLQGINANIMSLGGIAISIGVMVDAAIVLIENVHRHFEREGENLDESRRWAVVERAALEVGRPIFFTLLLVALSFLPVFALQAQEGRLFAPLAFTKTYAMAAAAGLAVTLVPVLAGYFIRGRLRGRSANPVARGLQTVYRPVIALAVKRPLLVVLVGLALGASALFPYSRIGSEFMPTLDEGSLMYMPTTLPGLSPGEARELLQQTDRIIASHPEVERVMGKIGRAETATDPAPLTMIETFITLKPRDQWRPGTTTADIQRELDEMVDIPGLTNAFVFPIQTRIDMLQTGIQTDVGILVTGPDLATIQQLTTGIAERVESLPGTASAFAERPAGGRYVTLSLDRPALARYGLSVADVHELVRFGLGGATVTETVEGLERFPVTLRLPADWRDSPQKLVDLPFTTPNGGTITLGQVAEVAIDDGPPRIRTENTRPAGLVLVEVDGQDLGDWVDRAREVLTAEVDFPPGYAFAIKGQYEYLERASERLQLMIPVTLAIIVVLLMLTFHRASDVALVLVVAPLSIAGGLWLMWLLGYNLSVGVAVGFIALAGLAAEVCVLMVVYLNQAVDEHRGTGVALDGNGLDQAIIEGAVRRVRPITMTQATVFLGLLPVMLTTGIGSEVMQRIAAPMIGGVFAVWLSALVVLPAAYRLWHGQSASRGFES
ncbi:efflux RND transporter permease subunit [Wenzhouxiangella sp. XN79A]|uniref:efflux RND transporter permease subunit n=1 Tax=Wenzhouxiangella sp. XN79A TaxID=2724193 RepID=UPI00144A877D|nr:CusA/CzcA family heavy metal efflux RND transporter [Wenzhouxiangella sp. XN79A]NKI36186.1 efflux RND transporter permease subunit [Wenzhouxiangella sp. XN79A]